MREKKTDRSKSPRQLAAYLGIGLDKVLAWIRTGKIAAIDVGGVPGKPRYKVTPEALEAFLISRKVIVPPTPPRRREPRPAGWLDRY